jgi:3-oxoacyl-[acyl-carrier protein] reductase
MPHFAPETALGRPAVQAYAARAGLTVEDLLRSQPFPLLTPDVAGTAIVELVQDHAAEVAPAYVLNGGGLHEIP